MQEGLAQHYDCKTPRHLDTQHRKGRVWEYIMSLQKNRADEMDKCRKDASFHHKDGTGEVCMFNTLVGNIFHGLEPLSVNVNRIHASIFFYLCLHLYT